MSSKVFVGNLSFKTREPDLAKAFEECGTVKSTNIIARGPRSLGYGFVEFEKTEDAEKSISVMNKKEIDGRQVNVELARPRDPNMVPIVAPGTVNPNVRPRRFPARPMGQMMGGVRRPQVPQGTTTAPVQGGVAPVQGGVAPRFRAPQRRFPARPMGQMQPGQVAPQAGMMPRQFQNRRPMRPMGQPFRPRAPRPHSTEISKTTLFVANLPFVVDDAGLLEIFEGMNVKEAHVVTRHTGRSKGYGFVTFENEADQQRAMQTVDKSLVENREISVHPAFAPPPQAPVVAATPSKTAETAAAPVPTPAAEVKTPVAEVKAPATEVKP